MAQTLGIIDLSWLGSLLPVDSKSAKVKLGGLKNTPVVLNRRVDYAQDFEPSTIEATIALEAGVSLAALANSGPGELQCVCDTGQTWIFPDAFITERLEATAGEGGKIAIKWAASEAQELLA